VQARRSSVAWAAGAVQPAASALYLAEAAGTALLVFFGLSVVIAFSATAGRQCSQRCCRRRHGVACWPADASAASVR
jgi:hypothetical protein